MALASSRLRARTSVSRSASMATITSAKISLTIAPPGDHQQRSPKRHRDFDFEHVPQRLSPLAPAPAQRFAHGSSLAAAEPATKP